MIERIKNIFKSSKKTGIGGYAGLTDFLLHAPEERTKEVFLEAAKQANKAQLETFTRARAVSEDLD